MGRVAMMPQPNDILAELASYPQLLGPRRYVVAYSGGLDSTVLLDLVRRALPRQPGASLLSVHVDHNLHSESATWSTHCGETAARLGVQHVSCAINVDTTRGESIEAVARDARYAALAAHVGAGDVLLTAHHRDDQCETVLLQLFRGAGVAGLAGMPALANFGNGWRLRPLLSFARDDLLAYAQQFQLHWIDDPSNVDDRYDRNFLRHKILPLLRERWPGAAVTVARSAEHSAAAARLMGDIGRKDVAAVSASAGTLDITRVSALSRERQQNALRVWLAGHDLPAPGSVHLEQVRKLLNAAPDATSVVHWPGADVRRYRNRLYAMVPMEPAPDSDAGEIVPDAVLELPAGLGELRCETVSGEGLDREQCGDSLSVRFRAGGESLRPLGGAHRRELRNLYQEAGLVPWMRDRIPLVYAGDRLVAVADLWLEHELAANRGSRGLKLSWRGHPPLY